MDSPLYLGVPLLFCVADLGVGLEFEWHYR